MIKEIKIIREKKKIIDYLSTLSKEGISNNYCWYISTHIPKSVILYIEHKPYKWVHIRHALISTCGLSKNITREQKNLIEESISEYYNLRNYVFKEW